MNRPNSIECSLPKATLKAIPATTKERKRFLQSRFAAFVGKDFPCPALGGNAFFFKKLHVLEVHVKYYGIARLTVGERGAGNFVEYCITNIKIARPTTQ